MEHNRDCHTIWEVYEKGKFADFPLNVDNTWQTNSSQNKQYNKSPYLIEKETQIAKFSVVTPEESKHIKPVEVAIPNMTPQGDPDLTAYLNEVLRTKKPEQRNNTFWFATPEKAGKPEYHNPIKTRILKELDELKEKEKLNPQRAWNLETNFANILIGLIHF